MVETCTPRQYQAYLRTFTVPDPGRRRLNRGGETGVIDLPEDDFTYNPEVGYEFEVAVMAEEGTGRKLLFVRIDSWDPDYRAKAAPGEIDYAIPLAYEGASDRERLCWTIPFGGAWSDTHEEVLLVFESNWADWFRGIKDGVVFSNPGVDSGALLRFGGRQLGPIREFCK